MGKHASENSADFETAEDKGTARERRIRWAGCVLIPCIGLALLRYGLMNFGETDEVFDANLMCFVAGMLGRGVVPLLMVVALNALPIVGTRSFWGLAIAAAFASAGSILPGLPWPHEWGIVPIVGAFVGWGGLGWLYVCWNELYGMVRIRDVAISTMVSLALSALIFSVLSNVPFALRTICFVLLPFAILPLFSLARNLQTAPRPKPHFMGFHDGKSVARLGRLAIMLMLYAVLLGAVHVLSVKSPVASDEVALNSLYLGLIVALSLALVVVVAVRGSVVSVKAFWIAVIFSICISLSLAMAYKEMLQVVLVVFAAIRYVLFGFINVKLVDIAHHSRVPLYVVFAIGYGIIELGIVLGVMMTLCLMNDLGFGLDTVATMLLAMLAMGAFIVAGGSSLSDVLVGSEPESDEQHTAQESTYDAMVRGCQRLRAQYGLTERESEVVLLVAQGYTQSYCAEALVVSLNTIRSHMKHIYTKLDIHSKDELLEKLQSAS